MKRKAPAVRKPKARKDARPSPAWTDTEKRLAAWAQSASIEARHARALAALNECEDPKVTQYQVAQRDSRYMEKVRRARAALADAMQRRGDARLLLLADAEKIVADLVRNDPALLRAEQARRKQRIGSERGAESARAGGAATSGRVMDAYGAWIKAGGDRRGFASAKAQILNLSASQIRRIVKQTRKT